MRTVHINLPTVEDAHDFVIQLSSLDGQFDVLAGRYVLDARSLMGILSLGLSKPLELRIEQDTPDTMDALKQFIV